MSRQTKVRYLKDTLVVDQKVRGLHIAVQDMVFVQVLQTLQQLEQVTLDLWFGEVDGGIVEEA
jgi:hypothetical protein